MSPEVPNPQNDKKQELDTEAKPETTDTVSPEEKENQAKEKKDALKEAEQEDRSQEVQKLQETSNELVSGQDILMEAESMMSGDAKEMCSHSLNGMTQEDKEGLGSLYYKWIEFAHPKMNEYRAKIYGKSTETGQDGDGKDTQKKTNIEEMERKIDENKTKAAKSISSTTNRLLDDLNGIPPAKYNHEKAMEEARHKIQREFDMSMPQELFGAEEKWFVGMETYFDSQLQKDRKLSAERDPAKEEEAKKIQEEIDKKGDSGLSGWLKELRADNLIEDIKTLNMGKDKVKVMLLDEKGKNIDDKSELIQISDEGRLKITFESEDPALLKDIVTTLNESKQFPYASIKEGKVSLSENPTLEQSREMYELLGTKKIFSRKSAHQVV